MCFSFKLHFAIRGACFAMRSDVMNSQFRYWIVFCLFQCLYQAISPFDNPISNNRSTNIISNILKKTL